MSQIEQVLFTAATLEAKGLEPSIALIKANLAHPLPMPAIVKGLQHFKGMTQEDKSKLAPVTTTEPEVKPDANELAELQTRVATLEALCRQLAARIDALEQGKA